MNNDLISRSTVIEILQAKADMAVATNAQMVYLNAARLVEKIRTVDAEPVRHGRWIGRPLCGNDDCRCSNCGYWENVHANIRGEITQKYCSNCGARMDGGM